LTSKVNSTHIAYIICDSTNNLSHVEDNIVFTVVCKQTMRDCSRSETSDNISEMLQDQEMLITFTTDSLKPSCKYSIDCSQC